MLDYSLVWDNVLRHIKNNVNDTTFRTWFNSIRFLNFKDNVFMLEVPSDFNKNIITTQHSSILSESIKQIAGEDCQYFIFVENENIDYKSFIEEKPKDESNKNSLQNSSILNPKYTFSEFVVGSNNQLAHAAALAVASDPGHTYNPLFVYGQVGIGKTHLIQAIAQKVLAVKPGSTINYVTSESFTNEVVSSIRYNKMIEFRNKYRNSDVLIIDDIQFIAGKDKTQEEFFHTFNALHNYNKQIILASDRPPSDITMLEERLRSRFSSGLICDIQAPDYETRVAILKKKADAIYLDLSDDVCDYIATNIKTNIREFEGALIRISALSKLTNMPITLNMATEALRDIFTSNRPKEIDADLIKEVVCRYHNISVSDIESKKRPQNITLPRQIAMYIIRSITNLPYADIGKKFGGRDHSTVISACNKIEKEMEKKEKFNDFISMLILEIKGEK